MEDIHAENGKYEYQQKHEAQYVEQVQEKRRDCLYQHFEPSCSPRQLQYPRNSQCSNHWNHACDLQVSVFLQYEAYIARNDNKQVHYIPSLLEISASQADKFDKRLYIIDDAEGEAQFIKDV